MSDASSFLPFAVQLADAAREQTLARWLEGISADNKASSGAWDPVTEADREAERAMRALIVAAHPDHGIDGEEFPPRAADGPWSWSLDPVDGTRSFVCQLPMWVTLIALRHQGAPVLGIIDAPCLGERYVGYGSHAALIRGSERAPMRTSGCTKLSEAQLSTTDPFMFDEAGSSAYRELQKTARTTRYGLDGYGYARVAAGSLDLVVESGLKTYDYNALIPVVRAAGGVFGDWSGGEDYSKGNVIAAASRELYEAAVEVMRSAA